MKKWSFQLSFLLFFAMISMVRANNLPSLNPEPNQDVCTLSPPAVFMAPSAGPTWINFAWSEVPGAAQYHLVTTEVVSGNVVSDMHIPAIPGVTNGVKVAGLNPGVLYSAKIWSVCTGGEESQAFTFIPEVETPVLDLVATGFVAPENPGSWVEGCVVLMNKQGGCDFSWSNTTRTYYKIKHANGKQLMFSVNVEGNLVIFRPDTGDQDCCNGANQFSLSDENGIYLNVSFNGTQIARMTIEHTSPTAGRLYRENVQPGDNKLEHQIVKINPPPLPSFAGSSDNRDNFEEVISNTISASPNPFTNTLEIKIPYATTENDVITSLYDLQGRLMLSEKTPGGTQIRSLSTENLLPGLYLLRVETGNRSETIKVVKTQ